MRRAFLTILSLTLIFASSSAQAQNVPIIIAHPLAVGAITRDAGLYTGPADLTTMKGVNRYLILLESDLASKVSSLRGVSYQDRTATAELLREVHMSSGRDFDPSSGAFRGLMGRLDFLVVIDAIDPATAKLRLIDVETGSIKGIETCSRRVSDNSACILAMVHRIEAAGRDRAGVNGDLAAARGEMMTVKPEWDNQVARYDAAKAFWEHIEGTISSGGHALRTRNTGNGRPGYRQRRNPDAGNGEPKVQLPDGWRRIELRRVAGVDVGIVRVVFAEGIVGDVGELGGVVGFVADAVLVVADLPNFSFKLVADGKGEPSLDELDRLGGRFCRSEEDVEVIGHDDVAVEEEAALVAVSEERGDHEFGGYGSLEEAMAGVGVDRDG